MEARYDILGSCVQELMKADIIRPTLPLPPLSLVMKAFDEWTKAASPSNYGVDAADSPACSATSQPGVGGAGGSHRTPISRADGETVASEATSTKDSFTSLFPLIRAVKAAEVRLDDL